MVQITLTLCFAYPNGSAKPTIGEIASFVKSLDANPVDMDTTYRIAEEKSIFIKFRSEESMNYVLMHNPEQLTFHYANGNVVEVRMSLAGGNVQYVRVYDLPPEVPDKDLTMVLKKYGKVKRVIREKFPTELGLDMYTGVRGVYMDVEKEIPSSLNFVNRKGNIFYSGNKDKCFLCKAEGHRVNVCPKRKAQKQHQQQREKKPDEVDKIQDEPRSSDSGTYAGVVTGGAPLDSISSQESVEQVEVLHEEVVEMEVAASAPENGTDPPLTWCQQRQKYWNEMYEYEAMQKKKKLENKQEDPKSHECKKKN